MVHVVKRNRRPKYYLIRHILGTQVWDRTPGESYRVITAVGLGLEEPCRGMDKERIRIDRNSAYYTLYSAGTVHKLKHSADPRTPGYYVLNKLAVNGLEHVFLMLFG